MCTLTIDVDEERIVKRHPWINRDVLNHYFQQKADEIVEKLIEVKMIPGDQVFAELCERYGFKV